jgi:hypothetical protein
MFFNHLDGLSKFCGAKCQLTNINVTKLRASNKMNCRIESERFSAPARRQGQNRRRRSQSYFEDDFAPDNAAAREISRLNAKAFC